MGEWDLVKCIGTPPAARAYHSAVPYKNRMLVFGGLLAIGMDDIHFNHYNIFINTDFLSAEHLRRRGRDRMRSHEDLPPLTQQRKETHCFYELEISKEATWRAPATYGTVPLPRSHHSAAMSPHNHKMILYGGYSVHTSGAPTDEEGRSLCDVYMLDPETYLWTTVRAQGSIPPAIWGHSMCVSGHILITFGGVDYTVEAVESDVLAAFNMETFEWRAMSPVTSEAVPPYPRAAHTAVLFSHWMVVFGGMTDVNSRLFNDVHVVDLDTGLWTEVKTAGEPPLPRSGHAAVVLGTKMYVVGGVDHAFHRTARVWCLDLKTFTWTTEATTFSTRSVTQLFERDEEIAQRLEEMKAMRKLQKQREDKLKEALKELTPEILNKRIAYPHSPLEAFLMRGCKLTPSMCYPLCLSHSVYSTKMGDDALITPAAQCASDVQKEIGYALYHMPIEELPPLSTVFTPKPAAQRLPLDPTPLGMLNPLSKYGFIDIGVSIPPDAPIIENNNTFSEVSEMKKLCDDIRSTRRKMLSSMDQLETQYGLHAGGLESVRDPGLLPTEYEKDITLRTSRLETLIECGDQGLDPRRMTDHWREELSALKTENMNWLNNANTAAAPQNFAVTDSHAIASAVKMREEVCITPKKHFVSPSLHKLGLKHKLSEQKGSLAQPLSIKDMQAAPSWALPQPLNSGPITSGERGQRPGALSLGLVQHSPGINRDSYHCIGSDIAYDSGRFATTQRVTLRSPEPL